MDEPLLLAIGGNSLIRTGQRGTVEEQMENALVTCRFIAALVSEGHPVVITHGNGPQVGAQLLRAEIASSQVYGMPLDACVASTQGEMGYILQNSLRTALREREITVPVVSLLTQVVVDRKDPAFSAPSKPVGPFYSREIAIQKESEFGWRIIEDAARGYRRIVPSPIPIDIVEVDVIASCIRQGMVVIAVGGGGIPVVLHDGYFTGVEAVIDKDRASALLAKKLHLSRFIISTDTDCVYAHYKKPNQRPLNRLSLAEAIRYHREGEFPPGSMGPKIEASIDFLTNGGREVIITNPEHLLDAVHGTAGTHIVRDTSRE